jgi:hypothetical protein
MVLLGSTLDGVRGYGDFIHFFNLASLPGWPFIHYWVEFPPIFPFFSKLLFLISSGREHTYDYLLFLFLTAADMVSLWVFIKLVKKVRSGPIVEFIPWVYMLIMVCLPYYWWYFDSLAVCGLLVGVYLLLKDRQITGTMAICLGSLVKFFPILGLAVLWRKGTFKNWLFPAASCAAAILLVYGGLYKLSPEFTSASIGSQANKGSWETIWAVIDGNFQTGNFGPEIERLDPGTSKIPRGNPAKVPPLATLVVLGCLGLAGLLASRPADDRERIALVGFAWCVLMVWSPGWSPQWVLYLIPLILLVFPANIGLLIAITMTFVNLMEWPILLSRGLFSTLPFTILLRFGLLVLIGWMFFDEITHVRFVDIRAAIFKNRN